MIRTSRMANATLLVTSAMLFLYAEDLVRLWVGHAYVSDTTSVLRMLTVANVIRLLALPLVTIAIGEGDHRLYRAPAIIEGLTNLVASVVLGVLLGAIGVAAGTLVGSAVSLFVITARSVPRTASLGLSVRATWTEVLARPLGCLAVLLSVWGLLRWGSVADLLLVKTSTLAMFAVGMWALLLQAPDRRSLLGLVSKARRSLTRATARSGPT